MTGLEWLILAAVACVCFAFMWLIWWAAFGGRPEPAPVSGGYWPSVEDFMASADHSIKADQEALRVSRLERWREIRTQ